MSDYNAEAFLFGAPSRTGLIRWPLQRPRQQLLPEARKGALALTEAVSNFSGKKNTSLLQCVEGSPGAVTSRGLSFGSPSGGTGRSPAGDWGLRWPRMPDHASALGGEYF